MTGQPVFETRERWFQGYKVLFLALAISNVYVLHALVGSAWGATALARTYALLSVLAFSAGAVVLLPRRVLRLHEHSIEVVNPLGSQLMTTRTLLGMGWSMARASATGWARGAYLRDSRGELFFSSYENPEGLWEAVRRRFLPGVAQRMVAALADGEPVTLWGAELRWDGIELLGEKMLWSDVDEVIDRHLGVLITYRDRPSDARLASRRIFPDGLLFKMIVELRGRRIDDSFVNPWRASEEKRWTTVRALPGMPAELPELGTCLYTHGDETAEGPSPWYGRLGLVGLAQAATGWLPLPGSPALWGAIGGLCLLRRWSLLPRVSIARGRFSIYEEGFTDGEYAYRFEDCSGITYEALDRFEVTPLRALARRLGWKVRPAYLGRACILRVDQGEMGIVACGDTPEFEACCRHLVRAVAPVLAHRRLESMQAGEDAAFHGLAVSMRGVHGADGFVPWESYGGTRVKRGRSVVEEARGPGDRGRLTVESPELQILALDSGRPVLVHKLSEPDAYVLQQLLVALEQVGLPERRRKQLRRRVGELSDSISMVGISDGPLPAPTPFPADRLPTTDPGSYPGAPTVAPLFAAASDGATRISDVPGMASAAYAPPSDLGPGDTRVSDLPSPGSHTRISEAPASFTRISEAPVAAGPSFTRVSEAPAPASPFTVVMGADASDRGHTVISEAPAPAPSRVTVLYPSDVDAAAVDSSRTTVAPSDPGVADSGFTRVVPSRPAGTRADPAPRAVGFVPLAPSSPEPRREPIRFGNLVTQGITGFSPGAPRGPSARRVAPATRLPPARAAARRRR